MSPALAVTLIQGEAPADGGPFPECHATTINRRDFPADWALRTPLHSQLGQG